MNTSFSRLWSRLASSKKYRSQFVSAQARRAFAFQLRAIMKNRGLTQDKLADLSGLTQGVISRAVDPNYGKLTTTVIVKIANGLDMAYLGILVPFSDAVKWFSNLSEQSVQVPTFEEENEDVTLDKGQGDLSSLLDEVNKIQNAYPGSQSNVGWLEANQSHEQTESLSESFAVAPKAVVHLLRPPSSDSLRPRRKGKKLRNHGRRNSGTLSARPDTVTAA